MNATHSVKARAFGRWQRRVTWGLREGRSLLLALVGCRQFHVCVTGSDLPCCDGSRGIADYSVNLGDVWVGVHVGALEGVTVQVHGGPCSTVIDPRGDTQTTADGDACDDEGP